MCIQAQRCRLDVPSGLMKRIRAVIEDLHMRSRPRARLCDGKSTGSRGWSDFRLTTVCPMMDVMRVHVAVVRAAGEAATTIAGVQGAAERRRDRAGLTPDIKRRAVWVFENGYHTRIARQTTCGFHRNRRTVFQLAATRGSVPQCFCRNVYRDQLTVCAGVNASTPWVAKLSASSARASARFCEITSSAI